MSESSAPAVTRDFTVATFVVWRDRVLLLLHPKLKRWLPPGGHVEPNELPDEAAVREVREETGVEVRLIGERALDVASPRQLVRPEGVQLEDIAPGHQHIDLVYFAVPIDAGREPPPIHAADTLAGWHALADLGALGADEEIRRWAHRAVHTVRSRLAAESTGGEQP
jgi:ADP-ribose pyrophosphatase YjhB (NUDIX family)